MSYPEKGAAYRNKPAWMDRAAAGEKRAQGGAVPDYRGDAEDADRVLGDQMYGAQQEKTYSPESGKHFWDSGSQIPGKQKGKNDEYMDRVRSRRADGGRMEPLIDEKGSPNPGNYWDHLVEPSSPHAAQDARNQAAERTRRAVRRT